MLHANTGFLKMGIIFLANIKLSLLARWLNFWKPFTVNRQLRLSANAMAWRPYIDMISSGRK